MICAADKAARDKGTSTMHDGFNQFNSMGRQAHASHSEALRRNARRPAQQIKKDEVKA
jgi:hypothetical protein